MAHVRYWTVAALVLLGLCGVRGDEAAAPEPTEEDRPTENVVGGGLGKRVFVLPVTGPIDKTMLFVFRRAFREAKKADPAAIVISLDTPGGSLKETEEIIAWMRSVDVPTYAFVNPNALSAGAIISLGTDKIFMSPGSKIGSAMPILVNPMGGGVQELPAELKEKMLSVVRAMVRGLAQENGYSEELATAMVDPKLEYVIGDHVVCAEGQLLNLTAREACEIIPPETTPLLAQAIVEDVPALLKMVGLDGAEVVEFRLEKADRLARMITMVAPLLMSLAVLAMMAEFRAPGFGLPGITAIVLFAIFFFGHYVAGFAGWEEAALVMIGIALIAVEIFVIPGFGVTGLIGIVCLSAGLIMGLIPLLPKVPALPGMEPVTASRYIDDALRSFMLTVGLSAVGIWALSKILPKTPLYRGFVLEKSLTQDDGFVSSDSPKYRTFEGHIGLALTQLRPAGIAMIDDERLDVVTTGDLIQKGSRVRVVQIEGSRIVVEQAPDGEAESPAPDPTAG